MAGVASASGNALSCAEKVFRALTTGPSPLGVDGATFGGEWVPARHMDLAELRGWLLKDGCPQAVKDEVWRELVSSARTGRPEWTVGCVGVALPGLKNIADRAVRTCPPGLAEDVVSEMVAEFIAQLGRIDLDRPYIAARLLLWARKGSLRARGRQAQYAARRYPIDAAYETTSTAGDDGLGPVRVLIEAVRVGVITARAAELINATRLEGRSLQAFAEAAGVPADRLYKQRRTAEARLARAIAEGQVSVISEGLLSDHGS